MPYLQSVKLFTILGFLGLCCMGVVNGQQATVTSIVTAFPSAKFPSQLPAETKPGNFKRVNLNPNDINLLPALIGQAYGLDGPDLYYRVFIYKYEEVVPSETIGPNVIYATGALVFKGAWRLARFAVYIDTVSGSAESVDYQIIGMPMVTIPFFGDDITPEKAKETASDNHAHFFSDNEFRSMPIAGPM